MSGASRISVVIPAYHSQRTVGACLAALRRQTLAPDEIIVVNSSPESETGAIVKRDYPEVIFEQSPVRLLPHAARNRGVELATGDVLVFTDPDCEAAPDWLAALVAGVATGHQCLIGAMDIKRDTWWQVGIHLCKFHPLLPGLASGPRVHAATANACYTRELWQQIGPFPASAFCGDGVLSWRAAETGHAPRFVPGAVVKHDHDAGVVGLCRQRYRRGHDYGLVRREWHSTAKWSVWLALLFSPAALPWVMARAGWDAFRAGWTGRFLATMPVQALGHLLWALGESRAALSRPRSSLLQERESP